MKRLLCILLLGLVASQLQAVPTNSNKKQRGPKDLSEEQHYEGNDKEHNQEYDHEAFLGKEDADTFDKLQPEEAKRRLGVIVDRIDKDKNGEVTDEELVLWIRHVSRRYIYDDVDRHWGYHDSNNDQKVSWEEYRESSYGMVEDVNEVHDHHRNLTYQQTIDRDKKRFDMADKDKSKELDKDEFADFLHPHEAKHMREVVIDETMTDMDKNKDGFVELREYIRDLWPEMNKESEDQEEPDWVQSEKEQFQQHRDKDGNGKLDRKELGEWVIPEDFDHAEAEAKHLIYEADTNKDKTLNKEEILEHQDLFVGSQATDFGDYLVRHDEF